MMLHEYLSWFDDVLKATEAMYHRVPSDKLDWKPAQSAFSLGQLIEHMPKALWFNGTVIASEEWPLKSMREILVSNRRHPAATVEEALLHLGESSTAFKSTVNNLGDEKFQRAEVNTPQWGVLPVWRFAVFVLEHHLNHKMELHMYLRLLGVKVNTESLYVGQRTR